MKLVFIAVVTSGVFSAGPVSAGTWGTYYNMATFGAGGGTDASGWFNFECAGADSGFATAGQPYFTVSIGEDFNQEQLAFDDIIAFWVDDGASYVLPMRLEPGNADNLSYEHSAQTLEDMRDFIAALRQGDWATVWSGQQLLARVALDGSYAALEDIEACVAGEE